MPSVLDTVGNTPLVEILKKIEITALKICKTEGNKPVGA